MLSRRRFIASAIGVAAIAACGVGDNGDLSPGKNRQLTWSEEFERLDLASPTNPKGKWRPNDVWQPLNKGYGDFATGGDSTWLVNPAQHVPGLDFNPFSLTDDGLKISVTRTPEAVRDHVNGCRWLGGMLISNTALPEMTFGYGYYEFRARIPEHGKGMFPAMWFYAARDKNPESQATAEIDLFEVFGEADGRPWKSTLHGEKLVDVQTQNRNTSRWHTYGIDWSADRMDFYRDGKRTASASADHVKFFVGAQMSIRVNFVMDARYFPPERRSDETVPDTMYLELDYIRRYE